MQELLKRQNLPIGREQAEAMQEAKQLHRLPARRRSRPIVPKASPKGHEMTKVNTRANVKLPRWSALPDWSMPTISPSQVTVRADPQPARAEHLVAA